MYVLMEQLLILVVLDLVVKTGRRSKERHVYKQVNRRESKMDDNLRRHVLFTNYMLIESNADDDEEEDQLFRNLYTCLPLL